MTAATALRELPQLQFRPAPTLVPPLTTVARERARSHSPAQGQLAYDFATEDRDTWAGPQFTSAALLPEPGRWSRRVLQAALEVMSGQRPANQMNRYVTLDIHQAITRRGVVARRGGTRHHKPPQVLSVHPSTPLDGIAEVGAVVHVQGRTRAVAMRLVGADGRWVMTVFQIG